MAISDRDYGLNFLRQWWNITPMGALNLSTFGDAVAHYDSKNPAFIASLGNIAKGIDGSKVHDAFEKLASQYGDQYPPWTDFGQALVGAAGSVSAGDIASAAGAGLADAAGLIGLGVGGYVLIIGVIAAIALLPELKAMLRRA